MQPGCTRPSVCVCVGVWPCAYNHPLCCWTAFCSLQFAGSAVLLAAIAAQACTESAVTMPCLAWASYCRFSGGILQKHVPAGNQRFHLPRLAAIVVCSLFQQLRTMCPHTPGPGMQPRLGGLAFQASFLSSNVCSQSWCGKRLTRPLPMPGQVNLLVHGVYRLA